MNKVDLGQTIQILANVGVIAGIVFLGVEISQNTRSLETQAMLERQNVRRVMLSRRQDNPALTTATVKALNGDDLDAEESFLLRQENILRLVNWEITFTQVRDGLLGEEAIPADAWRWEFNDNFPLMRETWSSLKHLWPPDFVDYIDENIAGR